MKVLFLTRRFYPDIGGVEEHVLELSKELIKRGHEVTVITEKKGKNYHSKDQSDTYDINSTRVVKSIQTNSFEFGKIKIFRLNFDKNNWLKKWRIWLKLTRYAKFIEEADVVHCHDVFFWYLPFRFLFPAKKVFITFHGYETKFPPTMKAKLVRKISEKLSNGNICVGEYIKRWYGTKPDYVTYGGVSISQKSKVKSQKFGKNKGVFNILLLGRLEEDNGARIYLEALKKLKKLNISHNLTVLGDGKYRRYFKRYGEVKGFVPQLYKYIDRSDFIFASSYLSILEGLIRGKNIFSVFQNQLKKDYLRPSPFAKFISIAGDADSLVNKLISLQNARNKSYIPAILAQNWAKKQTWGRVTDIYLKLWEK